ncbi:MAG TPA: phosphatidylserine decarboxylase [Bryobacteraceae bacterium]|nr:phosphatidylserine decarboxylase [Bryobacteraceae bacterium]
MVKYGFYYAAALLAGAGVVTYLTNWYWAIPLCILALFCLYFFRDPDRKVPLGAVAVSPADGKVVVVKPENGGQRISIFLNVFDVHVNRTPIPGRIVDVQYKEGQFLVASKEAASHSNEQNTITVEGTVGGQPTRIVFKQIAGLIARRIICYKKTGDTVAAGERVGLIKFGSRVDVQLGPEWEVAVRVGERVSAGSSVIARKKS